MRLPDTLKALLAFYWWLAKQSFYAMLYLSILLFTLAVVFLWVTRRPSMIWSTDPNWLTTLSIIALSKKWQDARAKRREEMEQAAEP